MEKPLRALIIEDSKSDTLLLLRELERGGYLPRYRQVETSEAMILALNEETWDVVLCDYRLPQFSAPAALKLLQESGLDLPFIIVSGTIGEDTAVVALKAGAHDYIMKQNLKRLVPAIEREIREAELRKERKKAEIAVRRSEEEYRRLVENLYEGIWAIDKDARTTFVNPRMAEMLGYTRNEMLGKSLFSFMDEHSVEIAASLLRQHGGREQHDFEFIRKDGTRAYMIMETSPIIDGEGNYAGALAGVLDITERKEMEEELHIAEQNFRNSIEGSPLGIRIVSADEKLLYANQAILDILGYGSAEELRAVPTAKLYTPESYAQLMEHRKLILSNDKLKRTTATQYETAITRKDGQIRHVIVTRKAVVWSGEVQFQVIYQDVTERKQAEEALRQSEEKLRLMFESLSEGIVVIDLNAKILQLNEAKLRMHGYSNKAELIGRSALDFAAERDRVRAWNNLMKVLQEGYRGSVEYNFLTKDGREFPAEVSAAVLKDTSGQPIGFINISQDITERKQAEEEIKKAAEEWRTTFDSITDLVSIHSRDFKLVRVNKAFAERLKKTPEELIGRKCYEVIHGTDKPVPWCPHLKALETKGTATADINEHYLGMYIEVTASPILNKQGEVSASIHVIRDVTERKRMEEQLILTDRLASIGELVSGIAHELNNPLTSVIGFSELILERQNLPADISEDLKTINKEAQRTAGIVRNLLTFARKHAPVKQMVDINSIVESVLSLRAYEHRINNIQVNTHLAVDLPQVVADGFQLQQVFMNIVTNAEYFMIETHGRGTLTVITEHVGGIVRISVADDGCGIAPNNLRNIFDPFFTTKEVGKGTGLGLSICHGIMTGLGGRIYAESELGKGATFIVELPVNQLT